MVQFASNGFNPFEKDARQNGTCPNSKHIWKHHPEDYVWKQPWFFSEVEDLKNRFSRQT